MALCNAATTPPGFQDTCDFSALMVAASPYPPEGALRSVYSPSNSVERGDYLEQWPGLPDRLARCECDVCEADVLRINRERASYRANIVASRPGDNRFIVKDNVSLTSANKMVEQHCNVSGDTKSLLRLSNELLIAVFRHLEDEPVSRICLSLAAKHLLGLHQRYIQTQSPSNAEVIWFSDYFASNELPKTQLLGKLADGWIPDNIRICWACYQFQPFGTGSRGAWEVEKSAFKNNDTLWHHQRTAVWENNWEVKAWLGEEPKELLGVCRKDERLRCPGCVLRGFKLHMDRELVQASNMAREGKEWLRKMAEKDEEEVRVSKFAAIIKADKDNKTTMVVLPNNKRQMISMVNASQPANAKLHNNNTRAVGRLKPVLQSMIENREGCDGTPATTTIGNPPEEVKRNLYHQTTPVGAATPPPIDPTTPPQTSSSSKSTTTVSARVHRFDWACGCATCEKEEMKRI